LTGVETVFVEEDESVTPRCQSGKQMG
jgi:hypothetical protein